MEPLIIKATETTPSITFDCEKLVRGKFVFEFSGESRPENVFQFFTPVIHWLSEYQLFLSALREKAGITRKIKIRFKFKLEYFNSSSAKYLLDILQLLCNIHFESSLADVKVIWIYDKKDEDMYEAGIELKQMTDIPFQLSPLKPGELL